ncbi:putative metalloprotease CJM1_0395 family protein [Sulfurospirillum sp. 1307]
MQAVGFLDSSLLRITNYTQDSTAQKKDTSKNDKNTNELTSEQKEKVKELQTIDQKVRAHEAAHIAAGGSVIKSGANFTYQKGPDNKLYAVAGEVAIDTSEENTPEKTIPKMELVKTAALAPADPSPTDYQVASTATMIELKARLELSKELYSKNSPISYANTPEIIESDFVMYA